MSYTCRDFQERYDKYATYSLSEAQTECDKVNEFLNKCEHGPVEVVRFDDVYCLMLHSAAVVIKELGIG